MYSLLSRRSAVRAASQRDESSADDQLFSAIAGTQHPERQERKGRALYRTTFGGSSSAFNAAKNMREKLERSHTKLQEIIRRHVRREAATDVAESARPKFCGMDVDTLGLSTGFPEGRTALSTRSPQRFTSDPGAIHMTSSGDLAHGIAERRAEMSR